MANHSAEQELVRLEKRFWQAMQHNDVETAVSLTDFPCLVIGPNGVGRVEEPAFREMMKSPSYTVKQFAVRGEMQARMLSEDVGVVAYEIDEKLAVDGKPVELSAADSSTWVRRNGSWRCALHSESIAGDAFGRDRSGAQKGAKPA
ncbi:MAG TPA: nuclear transport factor 2 family protein [Myxococcota bacterium]|nr:nuclear transport factor 2 family protein [Myxococcota bacterium]